MKLFKLYIIISLLSACAPSIHKGYEAFSIYDYFKAKQIFTSKLKTKQINKLTGAQTGLVQIYARHDNPFFQLDSAIHYLRLAKLNYELIPKDKSTLFYRTNISSAYLDSLKQIIDLQLHTTFPKMTTDSTSLEAMEQFIFKYQDHSQIEYYKDRRDTLAFSLAKSNGAAGMYHFIKSYPKSKLRKNAEKLRDEFIFKSSIEDNSFESFERFVQLHEKNEYKLAAIDSLYELSFKNENIEWLERLLKDYPSEKHTQKSMNLWLYKSCIELAQKPTIRLNGQLFDNDRQTKINQLEKYRSQSFLIYPIEEGEIQFVNENGIVLSTNDFQEAQLPHDGLSIIGKDNNYNLSDWNGKTLLPNNYEDMEAIFPFHYVFSKNNKYGVINALGQIIVPAIYEELNFNKTHGFLIALKNKKFGLITCFNNIVLPFKYDNISDINNGLCLLKNEDKLYLYQVNKKTIKAMPYEWMDNSHAKWMRVKNKGKYGIISYDENVIVTCDYERIKILNDSLFFVVKNDLFGICNTKQEWILALENKYDEAIEKELLVTKNYKKTISELGDGLANHYNQEVILKNSKQKIKLLNNKYALINKNKVYKLYDLYKKQIVSSYKSEPLVLSSNVIYVLEGKKNNLIHLMNSKKVECDEVEKWHTNFISKHGMGYQILDEQLNLRFNKDFTSFEIINETCLKLSQNDKGFIFNQVSGQLIEIK